ncbi:MAG: hypothetical protein J6R05_04445, partial [Bacteroidaceae bacterium]|nr:hypothetical protein [Bacteroidaceae bacterium]
FSNSVTAFTMARIFSFSLYVGIITRLSLCIIILWYYVLFLNKGSRICHFLQAKQLIFSDFSLILQNYVVTLLSEKGKVDSD